MTQTFHQLRVVEDKSLRIDGERREFEEGQIISANDEKARYLVNTAGVAEFMRKQHEVEDPESSIITNADVKVSDEDEEDEFSFEEYVDENNVDPVVEDVENEDNVAWLENLRNHDDRTTVQDAIDERLDELQ